MFILNEYRSIGLTLLTWLDYGLVRYAPKTIALVPEPPRPEPNKL